MCYTNVEYSYYYIAFYAASIHLEHYLIKMTFYSSQSGSVTSVECDAGWELFMLC